MGLPLPRRKQIKTVKRSSRDVYMDELTVRLARVEKYLPTVSKRASV